MLRIAFEIIMLVMLILVLIYKVGMSVCGKDSLISKRKAAKLQSDTIKVENLKQRFEKNVTIEPKKETKEPVKENVVTCKPFIHEP